MAGAERLDRRMVDKIHNLAEIIAFNSGMFY
jgi:hypothetical protein